MYTAWDAEGRAWSSKAKRKQKNPRIWINMSTGGNFMWIQLNIIQCFCQTIFLKQWKGWNRKRLPIFFSNNASPRFCFFPPLAEPCFRVPAGFPNFREVGRKKFEDFFLSRPSVRRSCLKVIIQKADIVDRLAAITKVIDESIQETIPLRVMFFLTGDVDSVKDFEFFKLFTQMCWIVFFLVDGGCPFCVWSKNWYSLNATPMIVSTLPQICKRVQRFPCPPTSPHHSRYRIPYFL